ncbi:MAG: DUF5667 domain-containing protein [bacterium]
MKEKQLLEQLNNLQSIKADSVWSENNREVLLQQVLNGEEIKNLTVFSQFNLMLSRVFQPAYVAVMIVAFFIASGVFGWYGTVNTTPGDSLYVAKIAREKAQMTVTFDNQAKARLSVEFAQKRLTELNQVIASKENNDREAKVARLKDNIKKEIKDVKERLVVPAINEEGEFFTAGTDKTDEEIDVAIPVEIKPVINNNESNNEKITEPVVMPVVESKTEKILTEAEELLDNDDFEGVANKLAELDQVINNQEEAGEAEKE